MQAIDEHLLKYRRAIHNIFFRLTEILRWNEGDEIEKLLAEILQQIHVAYSAKDKELLNCILDQIEPYTESNIAEAINETDALRRETQHLRAIHNVVGIHLN